MSILLVRHGEAVGSQGDDGARYLTFRGRSESRKVALALKELGHLPTQIITSPLVRAVQTAEIMAHALGFEGTLTTNPALVPDGDPQLAVRGIPISAGLTMVVTHEPIVRQMAALLVQQPTFAAFRTSGATMFEGARVTLSLNPETA
jgi:phosphohistidine phosphatase